jgi:hypothetical protein
MTTFPNKPKIDMVMKGRERDFIMLHEQTVRRGKVSSEPICSV